MKVYGEEEVDYGDETRNYAYIADQILQQKSGYLSTASQVSNSYRSKK